MEKMSVEGVKAKIQLGEGFSVPSCRERPCNSIDNSSIRYLKLECSGKIVANLKSTSNVSSIDGGGGCPFGGGYRSTLQPKWTGTGYLHNIEMKHDNCTRILRNASDNSRFNEY